MGEERGLIMALHGIMIAVLAYLIMVFLLKQSTPIAENRSVLLGAVVAMYMVLFGHGLPGRINKNI
jgi:hypothetical protein